MNEEMPWNEARKLTIDPKILVISVLSPVMRCGALQNERFVVQFPSNTAAIIPDGVRK
jgi:hypothetical protein